MLNKKVVSQKLTLRDRIENIMTAITFAEANQHDTALEMLTQRPDQRLSQRPQRRKESRTDRRPVLMA